ncbi:MAG: hypothetical protein J6N56_03480 [Bacteroidales bacterium]|nr:hypothetical protein [Bacteroidales bacterium]
MENHISREKAVELLKKYNKDPFHIHHALTVEAVMRWYANQLGFAQEKDFWGSWGFSMILILRCIPRSIASRPHSCCMRLE